MPESREALSALWTPASSAMIATLQPRPYDRLIKRMTITGPASSTFKVYRGFVIDASFLITQTRVGVLNTSNLQNPIRAFANETLRMVWTGGSTTSTSTASIVVEYDWEI